MNSEDIPPTKGLIGFFTESRETRRQAIDSNHYSVPQHRFSPSTHYEHFLALYGIDFPLEDAQLVQRDNLLRFRTYNPSNPEPA